MRTIQELAGSEEGRDKMELAAEGGATDTSTTSSSNSTAITSTRLTRFTEEIARVGQDFRYFQNLVNHDTELVGTRDYGKRLFLEEAHLSLNEGTDSGNETDVRNWTELTNLHYIDSAINYYQYGIVISKEIADTSHIDLVDHAKYSIVQDVEKNIENNIITEYETSSTNTVYGGDATSTASLESGDVLTPDVIADADQKLRENNYEPFALVVHPVQTGQLKKDSQFVNAAEYGSNEVVMKGEIGQYLGVRVISTTNIAQKTTGDWSNANGRICFMIGKNQQNKFPATLVWKEKPNYDYEFRKRRNAHYIYADAAYDVELLLDGAVCQVQVTDN